MKRMLSFILALILSVAMVQIPAEVAFADDETTTFEKYGLADRVIDLGDAAGKSYDYITADKPGGDHEITAKLQVNWAVWDGRDNMYLPEGAKAVSIEQIHDLDKEMTAVEQAAGQGYEWRCVEVTAQYPDPSQWAYWIGFEDYYDTDNWDLSKGVYNRAETNKVTVDGHSRTCYKLMYGRMSGKKLSLYLLAYVPAGYDGIVLTVMSAQANSQKTWPWGKHFYDYINDNSLFFRMR